MLKYEIMNQDEIINLINNTEECNLALAKDNIPYIVPMKYKSRIIGEDIYIFMNSKNRGKKIEYLKKNKNICLEMKRKLWSCKETIIVSGKVSLLNEKKNICNIIVKTNLKDITGRRFFLK